MINHDHVIHTELLNIMKKIKPNNVFIGTAVLLTAFSCTRNTPKIDYNVEVDTVATPDDIIRDTTKLLASELPARFDSTNVLIYAVGLVDLEEKGGYRKIGSGSYSGSSGSGSYFHGDDLSGRYVNLVFEDETGARRMLTTSKMTITGSIFLRRIFNKTKRKFLLHFVYDRDTNGDGVFDGRDLEALYLSNIDGTSFRKITKELHEFYDYRILKDDSILYFRTLEDLNKDGKLNNKDRFHHYRLDLGNDEMHIEEYDPLDIF